MSRIPDKINLLLVAASLDIGGAEVVIQRLIQAVDRSRFKLTICCIRGLGPIGEALSAEGFDIKVLADPASHGHGYLTFLKLLKLIRKRRIHIMHTHTTDALFDAALCRLVMPRVRLVHTFHFGNYPHRTSKELWLERIGTKLASRLVAVGVVQRKQILATFGFEPRRVTVVRNGVTPSHRQSGEEFRRRIGVTDHVLVGVTATMISQKGLSDFLAVASRFRDQSEGVRFVIVGDGALRPELEEKRRELGLEKLAIFAGWMANANEIALPAFDIFFQPSLWEAMSIALLEAMAAAKPVVATRVGDAPHMIDDGVDGYLVEPRDVDGMTAALRRLIDDSDLRSRIGGAAREKVSKCFSVERMTRSYETIYEEVFQGRSRIR